MRWSARLDLADAVAALAGDRDKKTASPRADAVRHRLEWTLEDLRAKQSASVALAAEVVRRAATRCGTRST